MIAAAWAALRSGALWLRLAPYLITFAAAAGILYGAYAWAYSRGRHSRDATVAALSHDRDTYKANAATLTESIKQQNIGILETQSAGDAKVQAGQRALIEAQRQNLSLAAQATDLRKSAGKGRAADDPCLISPTLAKATL